MRFYLKKLILWPTNKENSIEEIEFYKDKINIVHGRSGTGKSSILSIVDYCLGASRCSIPVGLIRDEVEWFGVVLVVDEINILIARRTPRSKQASKEFYVKNLTNQEVLPDGFTSNYNDLKLKDLFNNRILRISNLPQTIEEETRGFDGRASYRDLSAFNFLPQHIVANPNTLFYKADSYEHKDRLKKIFPLALGVVNNEYLLKERQRAIKQRELESLLKKQQTTQRDINAWTADVNKLWLKAIELGLIIQEDLVSTEDKIKNFQDLCIKVKNDNFLNLIKKPNYLYSNEIYQKNKKSEIKFQQEVDKLRTKIRNFRSLSNTATNFSSAVDIEKNRVANFEWFKQNLAESNHCIACGSESNQLNYLINNLEMKVNKLNELSGVLYENPVVDLEIEKLEKELVDTQYKLHEVRKENLVLEVENNKKNDSLSQIYILLGRIEALLINYQENKNEDDLSLKIKELTNEIQDLDQFFMNSGKIKLENSAYERIGNLIEIYSKEFHLDQRGKISLDKTELTLRFDQLDYGIKEYLWEVGSGENWMGYHISTFLALHEYFANKKNSPVFNFLVIDQPSQVYFPTTVSGYNELDDIDLEDIDLDKVDLQLTGEEIDRNYDIAATKRIFEMLELGLKRSNFGYQIIVLEHADQSIWGNLENTVEIRSWKKKDDGLIPKEWIRTLV